MAAAAKAKADSAQLRVMIVDDSMAARTLLRRSLSVEPNIEIVASVGAGDAALASVAEAAPDVLLLDLDMPGMQGVDGLAALRAKRPGLKIVILASSPLSDPNAGMRAMRAGAAEFMVMPADMRSGPSSHAFEHDLRRKVLSLANARPAPAPGRAASGAAPTRLGMPPRPALRAPATRVSAIAIGCSTGGPQALANVLGGWKTRSVSQPVFITQHMPATFTSVLAEHLSRSSGMPAAEAVDGEAVAPDRIYIAPGDRHMIVEAGDGAPVIRLDDGPQVNFCRPAADPMFFSLAKVYRAGLVAAVLTGMGRDGCDGAGAIKAAGGHVFVQDEASSVVWGMPGAVSSAGFADDILPLDDVGPALAAFARGGAGR